MRTQYAEKIHEAWIECEHGQGEVDFGKLTSVLKRLSQNAKLEGLPLKEFDDLVRSTLPGAVGKLKIAA
ncbi:MAG: hypothetical protein ACXWPM_07425 [Bdellovibrionota bacterium]